MDCTNLDCHCEKKHWWTLHYGSSTCMPETSWFWHYILISWCKCVIWHPKNFLLDSIVQYNNMDSFDYCHWRKGFMLKSWFQPHCIKKKNLFLPTRNFTLGLLRCFGSIQVLKADRIIMFSKTKNTYSSIGPWSILIPKNVFVAILEVDVENPPAN